MVELVRIEFAEQRAVCASKMLQILTVVRENQCQKGFVKSWYMVDRNMLLFIRAKASAVYEG